METQHKNPNTGFKKHSKGPRRLHGMQDPALEKGHWMLALVEENEEIHESPITGETTAIDAEGLTGVLSELSSIETISQSAACSAERAVLALSHVDILPIASSSL